MNDSIVGKWRWDTITYEFFKDGTYSYVNTGTGVRNSGNYMVLGNILSFPQMGSSTRISLQGNSLVYDPIINGVVQKGCVLTRI